LARFWLVCTWFGGLGLILVGLAGWDSSVRWFEGWFLYVQCRSFVRSTEKHRGRNNDGSKERETKEKDRKTILQQ